MTDSAPLGARRACGRRPGPLSIFTTHFFELTTLEASTAGAVVNKHVDAAAEDEFTLLYEVVPGPATESFGVRCAAGLDEPPSSRSIRVGSA